MNQTIKFIYYRFGECNIKCRIGGRLDSLCLKIKNEFPFLKMYKKSSRWYWRVVGIFLKIISFGRAPDFCKSFTTTTPGSVFWSDDCYVLIGDNGDGRYDDYLWEILCHEIKHIHRFKNYGFLICAFMYLFVFFPIGLAWGRAVWFEKEGYVESLRCAYETRPDVVESEQYRTWWVGQFTGANYAWMWPFRWQVEEWFDSELNSLRSGHES